MAADHVQRDADSAALAEIGVILGQFKRRAYETSKSKTKLTLESLAGNEVPFEYGRRVGRANALESLKEFLPDLERDIKQARALLALEAGKAAS